MAFNTAGGYGNLPNGAFSPIIFSQKALKQFRKISVAEDITNTDYAGEIQNYGDTVHIMKEPDITIVDYVRGKQLVSQDIIDQDIIMTIDQAKAYQFGVDDIEKRQSHLNWESMAADKAAYKIKDSFDVNILSYMATNSTTNFVGTTSAAQGIVVSPTGTELTPLQVMARMKRQLDVLNVPLEDRWFVADPYFWELMGDENSKLIPVNVTGDAESALRNGRIMDGMIRGFKCYQSNNLPTGGTGPTATSGGTNYGTILAGHMSAVATASQLAQTEKFRSQNTFGDIVRGMHLYGRKMLRTEAVSVGYWNMS